MLIWTIIYNVIKGYNAAKNVKFENKLNKIDIKIVNFIFSGSETNGMKLKFNVPIPLNRMKKDEMTQQSEYLLDNFY